MPRTLRTIASAACFAALALACAFASAADPAELAPAAIVHQEPAFFIRADVNKASRAYREGEALSVSVLCEVEAFVYVLYQQADGKVFQIFPNKQQPVNKIPAKTRVVVPAADDSFRWEIGAPFGKESIKVIAALTPIQPLDNPELKQGRFNPVTLRQIGGVGEMLRKAEAAKWAEDIVEITTASEKDPPPPVAGRRVGVFFGTSKYQFDAETREATGGKGKLDLPYCANGAKTLSKLMHDFGRLDDMRVYVNEQATKKQMEQAITQWLPSVTRPGDTVIIFNGGHGGQLPDDNGDEADGKDEFLLLHDYVDFPVLEMLVKQKEEGKLAEDRLPLLASFAPLVRGAKTNLEIHQRLKRHTGVSDDLLGHWLQRLAGRQILLILDTCHAGGFVVQEKGFTLAPPAAPAAFDFLDGEIARLKDLGQRDQALLAACGAQESSYGWRLRDEAIRKWRADQKGGKFEEWVTDDLAVLTYFIAQSVVEGPQSLTLEETHASCQKGMKNFFDVMNDYFMKRNEGLMTPHTAYLFNYSTKPVLLKP